MNLIPSHFKCESFDVLDVSLLLPHLNDLVVLLDEQYNITDVNLSAQQYLTLDKHVLLNINFNDLNQHINLSVDHKLGKVVSLHNKFDGRFNSNLTLDDGTIKSSTWKIFSIESEQKVSAHILIGKEISSEKKIIAEALEREAKLNSILSSIGICHWWKDLDGRYQGCSPEVASSLGLKPDNFIGKTDHELPWRETADELCAHDKKALETGESVTIEEEAKSIFGEVKTFAVTKSPLRNQNNDVIGTVGFHIDITDRKKLEHELTKAKKDAIVANETKSEFLANISHDMRSPLVSIIGVSEILQESDHAPEQQELIDCLGISGQRLLQFVDEILDFEECLHRNTEVAYNSINLASLIEESVTVIRTQAIRKGLSLEIKYPDFVPRYFLTDSNIFHRILGNFLSNAIKFTNQGYIYVTISCINESASEAVIKISVEDSGIGIPEDKLTKIFEPFTRIGYSDKSPYKGTGLGLAIAKLFIESLNGKLGVYSKVGVGTTFDCTFTLMKTNKT